MIALLPSARLYNGRPGPGFRVAGIADPTQSKRATDEVRRARNPGEIPISPYSRRSSGTRRPGLAQSIWPHLVVPLLETPPGWRANRSTTSWLSALPRATVWPRPPSRCRARLQSTERDLAPERTVNTAGIVPAARFTSPCIRKRVSATGPLMYRRRRSGLIIRWGIVAGESGRRNIGGRTLASRPLVAAMAR